MVKELLKDLNKFANPVKAKVLARFFKTGKGGYGEGDKFLGIMVPQQRVVVKKYYKEVNIIDIQKLLDSQIHEHRLTGVLLLVAKYKKANALEKENIYSFYLKNLKLGNINNWDLVDLSAPNIVGDYLFDKDRSVLYHLANSSKLWERRVSVLATFFFIRQKDFTDALKIYKILLKDKHDLIHKAVGWMLRESGKRDKKVLIKFLDKFCAKMPRVTLRYSIEKLEENERQKYLLIGKKLKNSK